MRRPKFLSPTSLSQYYSEPEEFYLQRIVDVPPPKFPQTQPMAIGSSFDAYVKNYLYQQFIGNPTGTPFQFDTMIKAQVENLAYRDWSIKHGAYAFACYKKHGSLAALVQELGISVANSIKMEMTVQKTLQGVPLYGKPDLVFQVTCPQGLATFVLDWKVNGYCSAYPQSPKKGYINLRPQNKMHKNAVLGNVCGLTINMADYLENIDASWAAQTTTYAWILGAEIGSEIYCGIDQLLCKRLDTVLYKTTQWDNSLETNYPEISVASFRMAVSEKFQFELMAKYIHLWSLLALSDDYIKQKFFIKNPFSSNPCFVESEGESELKCNSLEMPDPFAKVFGTDQPGRAR